ncbi:DNA repair exonuclease [Bacillus sp. FJAT-29790]|uniref:metallophosphoesterase family protein n=1 Tax=Bacillus sp. FJAT-29790 TaxID=1895002 RepID=UPI001C231E59|nr:DNA repair exonuclease [Bacillus sp. FJAT-29790]MBU8880021.1 DNA repair exonuclease [Bacillus sp. FJAT-29790]
MKKVTFIHAADLHLDSPMIGLKHLPQNIFRKLQESTFDALTNIVNAALVHNVDFVILAGDLFDGEDRSIRAQTRFRKEMERLAEKNISVFAVHGNHDHMEGNWAHLPMPENVHIFSHEVETVKYSQNGGSSVHLYGFSYPKRHVYDRMINNYSKKEGADFHIGILHGHFDGSSDHGKYAPFTLKDLVDKGFDYWALGHIHKRETLCEHPPVIYPGNIQGRHRKETGMKGCYCVHLTDTDANLGFIETSTVIWKELTVDASECSTFHDIYLMCREIIDKARKEKHGILLSLSLENVNIPTQELKALENGELLEILQEEEKEEEAFVWISNLSITEKIEWNREQLANESDFYNELFKTAKEYEQLDRSISTLYDSPAARKFLEGVSVDEKRKLAEEAENLLVNLLS